MKGYVDGLRATGDPISEELLILYMLAGVGHEYESALVNLTVQEVLHILAKP